MKKKLTTRQADTCKDFKRLLRRVIRKVGTELPLEMLNRIERGERAETVFEDIKPRLPEALARAKGAQS
jgi:hypothetical protein